VLVGVLVKLDDDRVGLRAVLPGAGDLPGDAAARRPASDGEGVVTDLVRDVERRGSRADRGSWYRKSRFGAPK
jgi:hypothetical protein